MKRLLCFFLAALFLLLFPAIAFADNRETTVYITPSGSCYHRSSCPTLHRSSASAVSLEYAATAGYSRCRVCKPPVPDFGVAVATNPPSDPFPELRSSSVTAPVPSPYSRSQEQSSELENRAHEKAILYIVTASLTLPYPLFCLCSYLIKKRRLSVNSRRNANTPTGNSLNAIPRNKNYRWLRPGLPLWYVDKNTYKIRSVTFQCISDGRVYFLYADKRRSAPSGAIGTRLFVSYNQASSKRARMLAAKKYPGASS